MYLGDICTDVTDKWVPVQGLKSEPGVSVLVFFTICLRVSVLGGVPLN